jgi:IMP cyclohydrolase
MYVGRIVAVGQSRSGQLAAMYRVSSRSFPNRQARVMPGAVAIVPKTGHESDVFKNPYIAYNCLRLAGACAVATNGSHTDPIAEKIAAGVPVRDALVSVMLAMDYEHDSLNTPRIAAVVDGGSGRGYLGIVRQDALLVRDLPLSPGIAYYVCTYEHNAPGEPYVDREFAVGSAADACQYVLRQGVFADLERPVTAACAVATGPAGFEIAVADVAAG